MSRENAASVHDDLATLRRKATAMAAEWAERALDRQTGLKGLVRCEASDAGAVEHHFLVQKTITDNPADDVEYLASGFFRAAA